MYIPLCSWRNDLKMRVEMKSSIISRETPESKDNGMSSFSQDIRIGGSPVATLHEILARIPSCGFLGKLKGVIPGGTKKNKNTHKIVLNIFENLNIFNN